MAANLAWFGALTLVALSASPASAQLATVTGQVRASDNGQPLAGATVVLADESGSRTGTAADEDGIFLLTRIRPGTYALSASFVGFVTRIDTLAVGFDESVQFDIRLEVQSQQLDEVVVEQERTSSARSTAGLITIKPESLARVPMPDVSYDLAGYLLTLPGFVSSGDRGGQLFVRGGTATQNLILVDGIPVYQPFHIVGFYSTFPADIISYADVYAGGFGARYGGRISSVIDIATRNGNKNRAVGAASIAPFLGSVRFELPIEPGKVSLLGSFRESLIERVAPGVLGTDLPFRFGDRFVKLHAFLNPTSSFTLIGLQSSDEGNLITSGETRTSSWKNTAGGLRYTYLPPQEAVMAQFALYYTRLESRYDPADIATQTADVDGLNMEMTISYLMGSRQVDVGIFGNLNRFDYDLGSGARAVQSGVTSGGAFIDTRFEIGRSIRIEPGLRYEAFSRGVKGAAAPRFRASFLPFDRQQWSFAWGRYHQQLIGLNNEQDVADVFTVWAPSPRNTPVPQATHVMIGVQQRATRWLEVSAEGYRKTLQNLSFPLFTNVPSVSAGFARVEGSSRGVDTRVQLTRRQLFLSLTYSLAEVTYEWAAGQTRLPAGVPAQGVREGDAFNPPHDRRHQVGLSSQWSRGPLRLTARWQYGSGLPFTQINGYYRAIPVDTESDAFHSDDGLPRISRGAPYDARLPAYHRLDISSEWTIDRDRVETRFQLGVINAYDRANLFTYNFFSGDRVNQLPLIPSFGMVVEVK